MSDERLCAGVSPWPRSTVPSVLYHLVLRWNCDYDAEDVDGRAATALGRFRSFTTSCACCSCSSPESSRTVRSCTRFALGCAQNNSGTAVLLQVCTAPNIVCMYVGFCISAVSVDIDNSGVTGPRQNLQGINVSML
jgi:hypothetical protein